MGLWQWVYLQLIPSSRGLIFVEEPACLKSVSSDWVVQKVKSFCHVVGLFCEGFEDELMALFIPLKQVDTRMVRLVLLVPFLSQRTEGTVN
jgi:hypothetical protein